MKQIRFGRQRTFRPSLSAATAILTCGACTWGLAAALPRAASAHQSARTAGFQPYKDAAAGFALAKPDGWSVRTKDLNIWVESPDKSELVLTRAFTPEPGQAAADWLQTLGTQYDQDFPQAALDHAQHVQTNGDEVIADAHYQGPKGAARMRILCRITNGKGWLYAFAAPADRYQAEQPKMLHVAQSIVFMPPKSSGGSSGGSDAPMTAAQIKAIDRSLHFVTWTEPTEHAYTLGIPQGWKVTSTMHRHGGPMPYFFYVVGSPQEDIGLMVGTPDGLSFTVPNRMTMQMGQQEGQGGVMHYMHAPEFNEFFLRKILGDGLRDITIEKSEEDEKTAQQMMAQMQGDHAQHEVSVGTTAFKATDSKSGKKIEGVVISNTMTFHIQGSDLVTWYASPQIISAWTGDAQTAARVQKSVVAYLHVTSSFAMTPKWFAQENAEAMRQNRSNFDTMLQASKDRSNAIAANSRATSDRLMSNFQNHEAAVSNSNRGFINYLSNSADVTDDAGGTAHVTGGYSHYYKNGQTGTVVGTNSAWSPGVDLTPMKEY